MSGISLKLLTLEGLSNERPKHFLKEVPVFYLLYIKIGREMPLSLLNSPQSDTRENYSTEGHRIYNKCAA
jgi:hypothetical protein